MQSDLRIVASLDIPNSVTEINKDIPKLEEKIKHLKVKIDPDTDSLIKEIQANFNEANNKANLKIIARLNVEKSIQLIQSDLNDIINKANAPVIELGVNVGKHNIEKTIDNELIGISKASQTVSDEMIKNFNKAFGISQKLAKEARTEIKLTMQDITDSWNSGNIDKYTTSMQKLMNLAGHHGITIIDPQTQEQINQIRSQLSDGSKVHIGEKLREDLEYSLGSIENIRQVLSNVYGVGKWTFDRAKGGVGTDNLVKGDEYVARMKEAILDANETITRLQQSRSTVIDNMSELMSPVQIEKYLREILKLSNVTKELTFDPNFGGAVVNIASEFDEIQSKAQQTGDVINKSLSGKYFSDNENIINDIKLFKQEEDAILRLTEVFNEYGATVSSVEHRDSDGQIKGFTLSVKSAAGTIEDFNYKLKNIGSATAPDWKYILQDINASDKAVQNLINSQQIYNDKLEATAIKLESRKNAIISSATTGAKPLDANLFTTNTDFVNQIKTIEAAIGNVRNADKTTAESMKANADAEIDKLKQMVVHFKNVQYAATTLREKNITAVKEVETNNLENFINQINNSKVPLINLQSQIAQLKASLSKVTNKEELSSYLDQLDMAKSKFKSLVEFYKGIDQRRKSLDQMVKIWKDQGIYVGELEAQFEKLRAELDIVSKAGLTDGLSKWITQYNKAMNSVGIDPAKQEQLNNYLNEQIRLTKIILSLRAKIAGVDPNKNPEKLAGLQQQLSAREKELSILQQQNSSMNTLMTAEQQKQYIIENTVRERERCYIAERNAADAERQRTENVKRQATVLKAQIKSYELINSKAAQLYRKEFDGLLSDLLSASTIDEIKKIRTQFVTLKTEIKSAGKEGRTFWQKMKDGAQKFSTWFSLTSIIMRVVSDIRKMVSTVIELDTCLVDLQKTFKGTASELNSFYYEANNIAKQLGVTTAEVIKSAAEWSRLGYSTKESAEQMAKMSSILKVVSPNMDMDTASSELVSIVKAFNIDTNDVLDGVISKINILGRLCRV